MADTFKITGYIPATQTVTVDFAIDPRLPDFAGGAFLGVKIQNPSTDTVANVTAFFRKFVDGHIAGKIAEAQKAKAIDPSVAALLNVVTNF